MPPRANWKDYLRLSLEPIKIAYHILISCENGLGVSHSEQPQQATWIRALLVSS
jgi:hypothetical protein